MAYHQHVTSDDDVFIGTDVDFDVIVYDPDATNADIAAGTATTQNITGWALSWMVKRTALDADEAAVVTKATGGSGIVITNGATGEATITLADTDTDAVSSGPYVHELKRTDPGEEAVLLEGTFYFRQTVHRT